MTAAELDPWDEDLAKEPAEPWEIHDDAEANWALRKIYQAEREIERVNANAQREVERILLSRDAAVQSAQQTVSFMKLHLIHYRRKLEEADPTLPKTYRLPAGVLSRRKGPSRYVVTDEKAFIEWAERNDPDAYRRTPLVSALDNPNYRCVGEQKESSDVEQRSPIVTTSGELVPGVERVREPDRYSCKPS